MKKICVKCKQKKQQDEFVKNKSRKDGFEKCCKMCWSKYYSNPANKERHSAHHKKYRNKPEVLERSKDIKLQKRYGITLKDYYSILDQQNNRCAICLNDKVNGPGRFRVDHDHKTGKVRGLLCFKCNTMLGNAKDDANVLINAAHYLARNA